MTDIAASLARPKIPVWRTAYDAYRLGLGAIFSSGKMFRYFVYGSVLILGVIVAEMYLSIANAGLLSNTADNQNHVSNLASDSVIGLLSYILIAVVQTPLGMAIHRRVLLGDSPKVSYLVYAVSRHGSRFLLTSIVMYAFFFAASIAYMPAMFLVYGVNPFDEAGISRMMSYEVSILVIVSIWFLACLAACLFSVKCTFAFPVAACGGPDASLRRSFAETRGSMWRLFLVFLLIFVPFVVTYVTAVIAATLTYMLPYSMAGVAGSSDDLVYDLLLSPSFIVAFLVVYVGFMLSYIAMTAGAARAYQIRVERGLSGIAEVFS